MKKLLSVAELLGAVVLVVCGIFLCRSFLSLYQASDAKQLSQTLVTCSEATSKLGANYERFHKTMLPSVIQVVSSSHDLITQLEKPTELMEKIVYFNFPSGIKHDGGFRFHVEKTQPFKEFQQPVGTFKYQTRPHLQRSLEESKIILSDFQAGASKDIACGLPQISNSIRNAAACIGKQELLNRKIAYSILAVSLTASFLLLISGIYHWKKTV